MAVTVATDHQMFIDGKPSPTRRAARWLEVRSPATGELVGRVPDGTEADVDRRGRRGAGRLPRRALARGWRCRTGSRS